MRRLFPSLTVALTGLVAACGTATVPPEEQGRRPAAWVEQSLPSERGADSPLVGHATDEGVVVATTTEDGTLVTHWSGNRRPPG